MPHENLHCLGIQTVAANSPLDHQRGLNQMALPKTISAGKPAPKSQVGDHLDHLRKSASVQGDLQQIIVLK